MYKPTENTDTSPDCLDDKFFQIFKRKKKYKSYTNLQRIRNTTNQW